MEEEQPLEETTEYEDSPSEETPDEEGEAANVEEGTEPDEGAQPETADSTLSVAAQPPFRPQAAQGTQASEEYIRTTLGDDLFNAIDAHFSSKYAHNRQSEVVADHYANQIEAQAPGFLDVEARAFLRQLSPEQQADPGAAFMAAAKRYIQKAGATGDVTAALDAFARDWETKRGKRREKAVPAVLPPSQRTLTSAGASVRPSMSPPRGRDTEEAGAVAFLKSLGADDADAKRYAREL